jgi:hypothetical protein
MRGLVVSHRTLFDDIIINDRNSICWLFVEVFWLLKIGIYWRERWREIWMLLEWSAHWGVHSILRHDILSFKLAVWRAVKVDEEVLSHVFNIVVVNVIIIWIEIVIVCDIISHVMWETQLISIHFIMVWALVMEIVVHIHLWLVVRALWGLSNKYQFWATKKLQRTASRYYSCRWWLCHRKESYGSQRDLSSIQGSKPSWFEDEEQEKLLELLDEAQKEINFKQECQRLRTSNFFNQTMA